MNRDPTELMPAPLAPAAERERLHRLVSLHGDEAVAFQATESAMRGWFDRPPPEGTGGGVAYVDTGSAWVAAGSPLCQPAHRPALARAFVEAARRAGRRAVFFGVESTGWSREAFRAHRLGEQPEFTPGSWQRTLASHRGLREQLRRARAKDVRVRRLSPHELAPGAPLRAEMEEMAHAWLASRHLEPMGFLVALEPFWRPEEHRYYVAKGRTGALGFLSAVPIPRGEGWLVEDILRGRGAPNGTTEALIDGLMRELGDAARVTLGLAPLSGPMALWARIARSVTRPLYDFQGLRSFKARLHPAGWRDIWLVWPREDLGPAAMWHALCAFARGRPLRFGVRSLLRHPSGPPWLLALPLLPWTLLLGGLAIGGRARWLGWSPAALAGWVLFDAVLALGLYRAALRPGRRVLGLLAAAATVDAILSVRHLVQEGLGRVPAAWVLRSVATAAPLLGAAVLLWAVLRTPPGRLATEGRGSSP